MTKIEHATPAPAPSLADALETIQLYVEAAHESGGRKLPADARAELSAAFAVLRAALERPVAHGIEWHDGVANWQGHVLAVKHGPNKNNAWLGFIDRTHVATSASESSCRATIEAKALASLPAPPI